MTINEFCKTYHVSHQSGYSAMGRHEDILKDHVKCSEQEEALAAAKGNMGIFVLGKRWLATC